MRALTISANPVLSECNTALVCSIVNQVPEHPAVAISGNAPGCATAAEVDASCVITSVDDKVVAKVSPNPFRSYIEITADPLDSIQLGHILDLHGRRLKAFSIAGVPSVDVSELAPGVYILELAGPGFVSRERLVKVE